MSSEPSKDGNLEALALLTSSYNGSMGELIAAIMSEARDSADDTLQGLANSISVLTNLLGGMAVIARTLVHNHAKTLDVEQTEILEALGRLFHEQLASGE